MAKHLGPAPESTAFDYAKAGAVAFPFVGSGLALFDLITAPSCGKRFSDWCEQLRLDLNELSGRVEGLTPEKLVESEAFNSAFAQSAQAVVRTHQEEKLTALRNAVLNVALGNPPSEELQAVFLNIAESITPLHIKTLLSIENPGGSLRQILRQQREVTDPVVAELDNRGLVKDGRPYAARNRESGDGLISAPWELSSLGRQFLTFIRKPDTTKK